MFTFLNFVTLNYDDTADFKMDDGWTELGYLEIRV
jgi:hypothetical protein